MHYLTFDYIVADNKLKVLNQKLKTDLTILDFIHMALNKELPFKTSTLNQFKHIHKQHNKMGNVIEFPLFIEDKDNIVKENIDYAIEQTDLSIFKNYHSFNDLKHAYNIPNDELNTCYDYHIDQWNQIHIPLSKMNIDMSKDVIEYIKENYNGVENINSDYSYCY